MLAFATTGVMAQAAKQPDPEKLAAAKKEDTKKPETNCVTKDKKGNCPPPPKSTKPTPKKVEKKDDKKVEPAKK